MSAVTDGQVERIAEALHSLGIEWRREHSADPDGGCLGGDRCRWTAERLAPLVADLFSESPQHQSRMSEQHAVKDTARIKFCQTCGRTDRWTPLKPRHFWMSGLCPGPVVEVVYRNPVIIKNDAG